jgi:Flp pilus assembly protein TadG
VIGIRARRRPPRVRDERGSLTVFVVFWSLVLLILAAVVIDGGLAISQRERAADLADQAARAEAQNIDPGVLRENGQVQIDDDHCALAAAYLASSAASVHYGTAGIDTGYGQDGCELSAEAPGNMVTVEVKVTYSPFVFDIFNGTLTVVEKGSATAQRGD